MFAFSNQVTTPIGRFKTMPGYCYNRAIWCCFVSSVKFCDIAVCVFNTYLIGVMTYLSKNPAYKHIYSKKNCDSIR